MRRLMMLLLAAPLLAATNLATADPGAEERRLSVLAMRHMLESQLRIMRVADPIRVAGAPFCGNEVGPVIGAYALTRYSLPDLFGRQAYAEPFIESASAQFELGRTPRVVAVLPNSPADRAGLRPGDTVTKLDGKKLRKGLQLDSLTRNDADTPVRLIVGRQEGDEEIVVEPEIGCAFPSRFWFGPQINAFAVRYGDLTGTYYFSGLLQFFPSDDELAVIMGHELAHLVLKHNGTPRGSRRLEADADYVGLYLTTRAGFDVSRAPEIWDRMTRRNPYATIDGGFYSHPISPHRSLALQETLDEIAGKRERGEPLEPEGW